MISSSQAIKLLAANQIICVPTDTVYGLAIKVSFKNRRKLALLKGNDLAKNYTMMVAEVSQVWKWWHQTPLLTQLVTDHFPGNLTIIALSKDQKQYLGIRIPQFPPLQKVIEAVGPIFATSTNKSGKPHLQNPTAIKEVFPTLPIMIGKCLNQKPSTIIKIVNQKIILIRQGDLKINS